MTKRVSVPVYCYHYEVTASTVETVPVGTMLVDARRELVKTWELMNFETGAESYFTGKRCDRVCSQCYAKDRLVNPYGHDWPHGMKETAFMVSDVRSRVEPSQ